MAEGPGIYDHETSVVQALTDAELVIVAVVNGNRGSGFSIQNVGSYNPLRVAKLLELMAHGIREEVNDFRSSDLNGTGDSGESGEVAQQQQKQP
jgi:hypothetical protein